MFAWCSLRLCLEWHTKKKYDFDPRTFLATIGEGRKALTFSNKQTIFSQGDVADTILYIQQGRVRLTVVSQVGKEATLGILSEREFFGEGSLAGQPLADGVCHRHDRLQTSTD